MIVVDSPNSVAFRQIPKLFGQPLVCLMSPTEAPESVKGEFEWVSKKTFERPLLLGIKAVILASI